MQICKYYGSEEFTEKHNKHIPTIFYLSSSTLKVKWECLGPVNILDFVFFSKCFGLKFRSEGLLLDIYYIIRTKNFVANHIFLGIIR